MPRDLIPEHMIRAKDQAPDRQKRRAVLRDTVEKMSDPINRAMYKTKAFVNHSEWEGQAQKPAPNKVRVIEGDWGDVTLQLTKKTGQIYAVLNMANAQVPGGGYLEGMVAQEENMYRRSDCHFEVHDHEMDAAKAHYTEPMQDLINGVHGQVYLDDQQPRVCIKGRETKDGEGYEHLQVDDYFLFYELKSAADDLRGGRAFNEASMRRKIAAQLDTLITKGIRRVILSAFGCGAFKNPPAEVARIYREELQNRLSHFDEVVFAIYNAGYDKVNNFTIFRDELDGLSLTEREEGRMIPVAILPNIPKPKITIFTRNSRHEEFKKNLMIIDDVAKLYNWLENFYCKEYLQGDTKDQTKQDKAQKILDFLHEYPPKPNSRMTVQDYMSQ